jgi:gamma-glutamylcyclotransferase (GGCT)/AIG2-like uncharacterized protein YtfP
MEYLFVYGTLKKSGINHDLFPLKCIISLSVLTTEKYSLHVSEHNYAPFMHNDESFYKVKGELYLIPKELLKELDKFEKTYFRKIISVQDEKGKLYYAHAYFNNYIGKRLDRNYF